MPNLKEVLENDYGLDLSNWKLHRASGVSTDGDVIVGTGCKPECLNGDAEARRAFLGIPVADKATPTEITEVLTTPNPNLVLGSGVSRFKIAVETGQQVIVEVFDAQGRRVKTLFEGVLLEGMAETLEIVGSVLPAGVYVIRAVGEDFVESRRMLVVR